MKFKDTYERVDQFSCAASGLEVDAFDEVEEDESGVPYPPVGWARITIEVIIENPAYADAERIRDERIQAQLNAVQLTDEQREEARRLLEISIEPIRIDPYMIEKTTVALSPGQLSLLETLGITVEEDTEGDE
jgi:hypothetical protein